jgi:hypothetical protein
MSGPACELVARCFAARTSIHYAHLAAKTYAAHIALNEFYEGIVDPTDEFAECYMGIFGQFDAADFPTIRLATGVPIQQLTDLRKWITENREECCEAYDDKDGEQAESNDIDCTELGNLIDNILAVIDRSLYKLKYLK